MKKIVEVINPELGTIVIEEDESGCWSRTEGSVNRWRAGGLIKLLAKELKETKEEVKFLSSKLFAIKLAIANMRSLLNGSS